MPLIPSACARAAAVRTSAAADPETPRAGEQPDAESEVADRGRDPSSGLIPLLVLATSPLNGRERQPPSPIRAAFYYPWFPEAWSIGGAGPYTEYTPALGHDLPRTPT